MYTNKGVSQSNNIKINQSVINKYTVELHLKTTSIFRPSR